MNPEGFISTLLQSGCTDEQAIAFLPLMLKQAGVQLEPATSAALFQRLAELVGGTPGDSDDALKAKIEAYYRAHPPPPALQQAVGDFFKAGVGIAAADAFDAVAAKARSEKHQPIPAKAVFEVSEPERK